MQYGSSMDRISTVFLLYFHEIHGCIQPLFKFEEWQFNIFTICIYFSSSGNIVIWKYDMTKHTFYK